MSAPVSKAVFSIMVKVWAISASQKHVHQMVQVAASRQVAADWAAAQK